MNFTIIFVEKPVTTIMIYIAIFALGIISLSRLSIDFLPDIKVPSVTINTLYPNATPQEIEKILTEPIESRLNTIAGVKKTSSISREGVSLVTVDFNWNVDMDYVLLDIREKLDQLRPSMPSEVRRSTVLRIDPSSETMMTIAITKHDSIGKSLSKTGVLEDLTFMKEFAESVVKRRLEQVDGVALADISGGVEQEIFVKLNRSLADLYGLTPREIVSVISSSNISIGGGNIKQGYFKLSLKTIGEFSSLDDIRNLVVKKNKDGSIILLKDIAEVVQGYEERQGVTKLNEKETIGLLLYKEASANTIEVCKKVHQVLNEVNSENKDLKAVVVFDQSEFITTSLNDVKDAILQGAFLAFIVLFLFLKEFRNPIIIGVAMPLSILITIILMDFFGVSINIISLTGLALGIGMLGDNSILIIENATRLREGGMSRIDAAIEGGKEINLAAAMSTFTNVAIFLPVLYIEGVAKELFKDMALTMTFSLLASLIVALTLVPMLISCEKIIDNKFINEAKRVGYIIKNYLYRDKIKDALKIISFDYYWNRFAKWYEVKIDWMIQNRRNIIFVSFLIFILSLIAAWGIPIQSTPEIDQQRFSLEIELPKGSSLEAVEGFVSKLSERILAFSEVDAIFSRSGIVEEQSVASALTSSKERSIIDVKIKTEGLTQQALDKTRELVKKLKVENPDINISLKRRQTTFEQILRPEPYDIKMLIEGKHLTDMINASDIIQQRLETIDGITDVRGGMQKGNPEYQIRINKEKCIRYNIELSAISDIISMLTNGIVASDFNDFDKKIKIRLRLTDDTKDITEILDYKINTPNGAYPLREFVEYTKESGYSEIWRENQSRVVLLTANVANISLTKAIDRINNLLEETTIPYECKVRIGGENEEIRRSFKNLIIILILSLTLVYILLSMEFESLKVPFVILITSPLAFIGAVFAMLIFGESYNLMSIIGIVIMIGAVDNDAVVALDFVLHLRAKGFSLADSIKMGMTKRLRSIVMTTATSVLSLVPLILMTEESSSIARSLSYPVAGGLITSTLFTLVVIPIVYSYFDKEK